MSCQGVYKAFLRNSKFMSPAAAPNIAFLANCVVELFGTDLAAAYEHAFTAIRQLASTLRLATTSKSQDAFRLVYCWQSVSALELWATLLAAHNDKQVRIHYHHFPQKQNFPYFKCFHNS
jgi:nucleolar complex protein 2